MAKSNNAHLFRCYAWLVNTIDDFNPTRDEINRRWANNRELNDDKEDKIVESRFHRWRREAEEIFGLEIECVNGRYCIHKPDDNRQ